MSTPTIRKFAITYIAKSGQRTMQYQFWPTEEEAEYAMGKLLRWPEETIARFYGTQAVGTFEVRPIEVEAPITSLEPVH